MKRLVITSAVALIAAIGLAGSASADGCTGRRGCTPPPPDFERPSFAGDTTFVKDPAPATWYDQKLPRGARNSGGR